VAHFECGLWRAYDGGDHTVFLGRVLSVDRRSDEDVLVFQNGMFRQAGALAAGPNGAAAGHPNGAAASRPQPREVST
jgi:flavin reductase (DIM6/NTAB) family NADH-FMN oxidoreductase RutF